MKFSSVKYIQKRRGCHCNVPIGAVDNLVARQQTLTLGKESNQKADIIVYE